MAKHYTITINVAYDEATIPDEKHIKGDLVCNIGSSIGQGMLDVCNGEPIVEEWSCKVVEKGE